MDQASWVYMYRGKARDDKTDVIMCRRSGYKIFGPYTQQGFPGQVAVWPVGIDNTRHGSGTSLCARITRIHSQDFTTVDRTCSTANELGYFNLVGLGGKKGFPTGLRCTI